MTQRNAQLGITTVISSYSMHEEFRPGGSGSSEEGKSIGRAAHKEIERRIKEPRMLVTNPHAVMFFDALQKLKIIPEKAEILLRHMRLPFKVRIDAIGRDIKGRDVLIEIKTTQDTVEKHKERYWIVPPASHCKILANGLDNTEYNRHQLQCAFAVLCVGPPARGIVINLCADGYQVYDVEKHMLDLKLFSYPAYPKTCVNMVTLAWPQCDESIRTAFTKARIPIISTKHIQTDTLVFTPRCVFYTIILKKDTEITNAHRKYIRIKAFEHLRDAYTSMHRHAAICICISKIGWVVTRVKLTWPKSD